MLNRRGALAASFGALAVATGWERVLGQQAKDIRDLKPGEFTWHPERSPDGPVAIVVSIPEQRVHVYRNGIRIAVSTCSTGRKGHATPTGVFTILQKDRNHRSSTYNNAPMPNMNRLTWSGIALHAGDLPGYPASHGCVRLPKEFSRRLFEITHLGLAVIIANDHSDPAEVVHPGLLLDQGARSRLAKAEAEAIKKRPAQTQVGNETPVLSILASAADKRILVIENGDVVADGTFTLEQPGVPLGSHVYVLSRASDGRAYWHAVSHHPTSRAALLDNVALQRIGADTRVNQAIASRLHEGATLTTTDLPLHADTRSGKDFVVMAEDEV